MSIPTTTILHISDIHFSSSDRVAFNEVWKAFLERVVDIQSNQGSIDFVCLTGDVVKAGDCREAYEEMRDEYLLPLIEQIGCYDRFFICPGNHDAQREWIEQQPPASFGSSSEPPPLSIDEQAAKFRNYQEALGVLESNYRVGANPLVPTYYDSVTGIGFVCINSALHTRAGLAGASDVGTLLVAVRY